MIYLPPLPADRQTLVAQIGDLESRRERLRALGRLSPERAAQIVAELRDLRGQLAVVAAQKVTR